MPLLSLDYLPFWDVPKFLIFEESIIFFHLFSVYMILTDGNISQRKIIETSQFVFKPTNTGLLIEKYYFYNNNQTLKSFKITVCFDTSEVVSYHSFVPLSLVALFHCFDTLMESFSLLITHIVAVIRKLI